MLVADVAFTRLFGVVTVIPGKVCWFYCCILNTIKTSHTVLRKIYLSLYLKGLCVRGSWRPNRTAHTDPHSYGHQRFFPVLLGCSTGDLGAQPLWDMFPNPASSHQLVWSPNCSIGGLRAPSVGCWLSQPHLVTNGPGLQTDWISCALSYIILQRPPSSCGCHKLHSFNPSTVKATLCYSSTGCTCYLHRWIPYFDSPVGW